MAQEHGAPSQPRRTHTVHYGIVVLALVVLAVFSSLGLGRFGYGMVLPAMQKALVLTNAQTGALQSWNSLGYLLMVALAGLLSARHGPRIVICLALLVVGLSMLATGVFGTYTAACVGRFSTGVGGAAANVPAMGLVAAWFTSRRRGLAAGIAVAGSSLGLVVTGPLVPRILEQWGPNGWRVCWLVFGALSLVVCLLCALLLRNRPEDMGLEPIGGGDGAEASRGRAPRASSPDWEHVYKSLYLWRLAAVYFAFGFSYIIFATFFVKHLVRALAVETAQAGALWLQIGLVSVVSGFLWGTLSDKWGRRPAVVLIFMLQGTAFVTLGVTGSLGGVYAAGGLFAITAWSIPAVMAAIAGDVFGSRLAPAALGLMTIVFGVGQTLGSYAGGRLADVAQSFSPAFILAGAVAWVLGAGGMLLLRTPAPASG